MGKNEGFRVEITSDYDEFWRYNIMLTCGCFDESDNRIGFVSAEDIVAPVGSKLKCKPKDYPQKRVAGFGTMPCDHLFMYLYVIPHTAPVGRVMDDHESYTLNVRIAYNGRLVKHIQHSANMWSGATLEVKVFNK